MESLSQFSFSQFLSNFRTCGHALLIDDFISPPRGFFMAPAECTSTELLNNLLSLSGGLCFVAIGAGRAESFRLAPMGRGLTRLRSGQAAQSPYSPDAATRFEMLESVEARQGVHSGISAADRARTVRVLADSEPNPRLIVKPGHVFPLAVRSGGVLVRTAVPEAAMDITVAAGYRDAVLVLDALNEHGEFASRQALAQISDAGHMPVVHMSELVRARLASDSMVTRVAEAKLPTTSAGELTAIVFRSQIDGLEHVALVKGRMENGKIAPSDSPVLTRVHAEDTCVDAIMHGELSTGNPVSAALKAIAARGSGVLVYLRRSYQSQWQQSKQHGAALAETRTDARHPLTMMREYGVGAQILRALGAHRVELLTGTKKNLAGLTSFGIEIVAQQAFSREISA